jgi:DNA repair protein SbcC/Rad50
LRDERSNLVGEQSDTQTKIKQCDSFIRLNSTKFECPTCDDKRSLKCKYVAEQNEIDEKLKEAGELLIGLNSSRDSLKLKIKELQVQMKKMSDDYENNAIIRSRLASIENTKEKIDNQVDKLDVMIAGYTLLEAKLEKAKKETDIHEHNEKIDDEIRSYKETVDSLSYNFSSIEEDIIELVSDIGGHKKGIENKKDIIDNIRKDIGLHKVYRLYEKIMHRENLPLWLLNRYIPVINQQISDILMSFVDFNVRFELDERKELQIIYSYSESDGRYVGMASGMEKMIIALSIRIVMTLISNISRPNMWIIDEGFSSLDDDQRTNMVGLMSMLRDMFNNVIIITHIDQIKDLVDHQLIAEKTNGVSRIK